MIINMEIWRGEDAMHWVSTGLIFLSCI